MKTDRLAGTADDEMKFVAIKDAEPAGVQRSQ
jgi:hypothetical protein